jgi:hypothetical protein
MHCSAGVRFPAMNRRLVWSLLFALLLPFAQLAAAAHEVSHVRGAVQDKSTAAFLHCGVCDVAAAVTGGAAASEPAVLVHAPAHAEAPTWQPHAPQTQAHVAHFLSRAPPFLR